MLERAAGLDIASDNTPVLPDLQENGAKHRKGIVGGPFTMRFSAAPRSPTKSRQLQALKGGARLTSSDVRPDHPIELAPEPE